MRISACAHTAPNDPVVAPITATGLNRRGLSSRGRLAQSIAFFRQPGIELLYSGVAMRRASARAIASRRRATSAGGAAVSRSSS